MAGYILDALEDLRNASLDGIHTVSRALSALEVSTTGVIGKDEKLDDDYSNLADVDRATRDVRNLLDEAMDSIYRAVRVMESLG